MRGEVEPCTSRVAAWSRGFNGGAANRIRTCDPVITNDVLYQLSYCGRPGAKRSNEGEP